MAGMSTGGTNDNVDTAQIMMKINMLSVEVNKKIDVTVINQQMDSEYGKLKAVIDSMSS